MGLISSDAFESNGEYANAEEGMKGSKRKNGWIEGISEWWEEQSNWMKKSK